MALKDLFNKEDIIESFVESPKKTFKDVWSTIKFVFSSITILVSLFFSVINIIFKVIKNGWSPSTYILTVVAGLYLLILLLYYILLKVRLKDKNDKGLAEFIYYLKYFTKIIKVLVPIMLLYTLIDNPVYDFVVIIYSIFSIIFGVISFIIATLLMVRRTKKTIRKSRK